MDLFTRGTRHNSASVRFGILFAGGLLLLLAPFAIYWAAVDYREAQDSPNWPRTTGEVYDRSVIENARKGTVGYTVHVKYRYVVKNQAYAGERVSARDSGHSAEGRDRVLAKYPVGSKPEVFYAPSDPQQSFLEPGPPEAPYVRLGIVGAMPLLGIALLWLGWKPRREPDDRDQ